jgi:hypothetical protein
MHSNEEFNRSVWEVLKKIRIDYAQKTNDSIRSNSFKGKNLRPGKK